MNTIAILTFLLLIWHEHLQPLYKRRQVRKRLREGCMIVTTGGLVARVVALREKFAILRTDGVVLTIDIEYIDYILQ